MTQYIRFDWAMKKLLRDKANFVVLEGFLSTLLEKDIRIERLLESESNQEDELDKQLRVDIAAADSDGNKYIIEVQNNSEYACFQRVLFNTSKLVKEYLRRGDGYENVQKVYCINIVYFDLGRGDDYIYHGTTEFRGIHSGTLLSLSPFQSEKFNTDKVSDLFPEYFVLKVNGFNDVAKTPLEEWIAFLKNESIPETPTAKGLAEAKEIMRYEYMSEADKQLYERHLTDVVVLRDNIITARGEGKLEGRAEGRIEGRAEGRAEGIEQERADNIRSMKAAGMSCEQISAILKVDLEYVKGL